MSSLGHISELHLAEPKTSTRRFADDRLIAQMDTLVLRIWCASPSLWLRRLAK